MTHPLPERPIEEPLSELERQFITEYLATAGADYHALLVRNDAQARRLAGMFIENFKRFEDSVSAEIIAAGPRVL